MMNGHQRSHRIADQISELQRLVSQFKNAPEVPKIQEALTRLHEAKQIAKDDKTDRQDTAG
jgi:hypothetical protein